jgi:galactokinase
MKITEANAFRLDMDKIARLKKNFEGRYGGNCEAYRAPGRVNLIGEHTDYNEGFVLPAALEFSCWAAAGPRTDGRLSVFSENTQELAEAKLDGLEDARTGRWSDYPVGVAWALGKEGFSLKGANLYFEGEVPLGAGLSSSAALEVSTGYALLEMARQPVDLRKLALTCRRAENEFVGAHVGIMDQFVACHGRAGSALLLDCRSLGYEYVPMPSGLSLVICNSMVRHDLAAGEYNARRAECEEGVRLLRAKMPGITALRDVAMRDLEMHKELLPEVVYRRCRHVMTENERVLQAVEAFRKEDLKRAGELMFASHQSLRDDFEVSCAELDGLVEIARKQPGLVGARMTGGGFGGCTVNLVKKEFVEQFIESVSAGYEARFGIRPEMYKSDTANGVERVR